MDSVLEDRPALGRRREQAGCFVLLTNLHPDGERAYSAEQVLRSYKQQYGIEQNFGFLKDEAIVNSIFLKTPARIETLGLILLLALLVWRLIEQQMRPCASTWNTSTTHRARLGQRTHPAPHRLHDEHQVQGLAHPQAWEPTATSHAALRDAAGLPESPRAESGDLHSGSWSRMRAGGEKWAEFARWGFGMCDPPPGNQLMWYGYITLNAMAAGYALREENE
jgi:hypothetical protein